MQTTFTQGLLTYPTAGNTQSFLSVSGSSVSITTTNGPTTVVFADGTQNYIHTETTNVIAWTSITSAPTWLYWDIDKKTGVRTFGKTTVAPVASSVKPSSPVAGLHWFNTTERRMYVYQSSAFRPVIRVFACRIQGGTLTPMGSGVVGKPYAGSQVGLTGDFTAGSIIVDQRGLPIRKSDGSFFTSADQFFTNGGLVSTNTLEPGLVVVTANTIFAPYTVVKLVGDSRIDRALYPDTTASLLGIVLSSVEAEQAVDMTVSGVISNPAWNWSTAGTPLYVNNGALTVTDPNASDPSTYPTRQPPVGWTLGKQSVFFAPMRSVNTTGTAGAGATDVERATTSVYGTVRLSSTPSVPTDPIVVGTNDTRLTDKVLKTGDVMSGPLILSGNPVSTMGAATKSYVDSSVSTAITTAVGSVDLSSRVSRTGDTMLGPLTLSGAPSQTLHASSKGYVDTAVAAAITSSQTYTNTAIAGLNFGGITVPNGTLDGYVPVTLNQGVVWRSSTQVVSDALKVLDFTPSAPDLTLTSTADQFVSGNVLTTATTLTGQLRVVNYTVPTVSYPNGLTYSAGVWSNTNPVGQFRIMENGNWELYPRLYSSGQMPTIRYTITNGLKTDEGTLSIFLTWVNHAPIANPDDITTVVNSYVDVNVLANDVEWDSQSMTVTKVNGTPIVAGGSTISVTNATVGLLAGGAILRITPNAGFSGIITFNYSNSDSMGVEVVGQVYLNVADTAAAATSNYVVGTTTTVPFNFSTNQIAKNLTKYEPTTGATFKRITDVTKDIPGQTALYNAYSRYPTENVTGEYCLAFAGNSTTCLVINRATGAVVATLAYDNTGLPSHTIGAFHEVRWHYTMAHPYRVYFVRGTEFWMIDDVRNQSTTRTLIKDFGPLLDWGGTPNTNRRIFNDQEGNSSLDSDHWAWMATYSDNILGPYNVRGFVHYQISTDTTHTLYPSDITKFQRYPGAELGASSFRHKPNTIEVAPDGSGILIMSERAYPGYNDAYIGTFFEAPYFWPIDFQPSFEPFRMMVDATHSGWSSVNGEWYYVAQDNRRDKFCAVPISGVNKGYGNEGMLDVNLELSAGVIDFHTDGGLYPGVHFALCTGLADGWTLMSTYAVQNAATYALANALFMIQIKPEAQAVKWHVAPTANQFPAANKQDYNEAPASINLAGTRVYTCGDWNGTTAFNPVTGERYVDLYSIELPPSWPSQFTATAPTVTTQPTVTGTASQGQTLTATIGTYAGFPAPTTTVYWQRNSVDIAGATGTTYLLTADDVGAVIRVRVRAVNANGQVDGFSTATAAVQGLPVPTITVPPSITGSAIEGYTLTASTGTWLNTPTGYQYQWFLNGTAVSGETASTLVIPSTSIGSTYTVRVIATNAVGSSAPAFSTPTSTVTSVPGTITRVGFVTSVDPSGSFETTRTLPAFDTFAGNLIVVATQFNQTGSNTLTVTDSAGNTYTPIAAQTTTTGSPLTAVQMHYCLSSVASTNNVITVTQSDNSTGLQWILDCAAVQYTTSSGVFEFSTSVSTGTDYIPTPVSSPSFNIPGNGLAVAVYGNYYANVQPTNTGSDTLITRMETSGWVMERIRASAQTGTTMSAGDATQGGYSRIALIVGVFRSTGTVPAPSPSPTPSPSPEPSPPPPAPSPAPSGFTLSSLSSYGEDVGSGGITLTATGSFQNGDVIVLWNEPLTTTYVNATTLTAPVPSTKFATANFGTVVVRRSATEQTYALPFESTPVGSGATSNYVQGVTSRINPTYGTKPAVGSGVVQTTTGSTVVRRTNGALAGVSDFRNIYSKWSSVNATNNYALAEHQDSFTASLIRLSDNANMGPISGTTVPNGSVGENPEPRWSTRGDEPNMLYYMAGGTLGGTRLCKKDVINNGPEITVKDFSSALGLTGGEYLYCDSEGTPSIDMRFWAFMRRDDGFSGAREIIIYDVYTDTIKRCKPYAASGFFNLGLAANSLTTGNQFQARPNWVSMSPRGDRIQLGYGRVYSGAGKDAWFGTVCDMPHTFSSVDFSDPKNCAVDETHGAWCWGPNMEQAWIAQNNRLDTMDICLDVTQPAVFRNAGSTLNSQSYPAANPATNNRRTFIALSGTWNNNYNNEPGQHYCWQMSGRKRGFAFVATDGTNNANAYGFNSLIAFRISDGRAWRVGSFPHQYYDYFSEIQWCLNPFGTMSYGSLNWLNGGTGPASNDCYTITMPDNWNTAPIWS